MAILCLTAFFLLQYGKIVSYWHCWLLSSEQKAPCDCTRVLYHYDSGDHNTTVFLTAKEKTEEQYTTHAPVQFRSNEITNVIEYTQIITPQTIPGFTPRIFQPPRS